MDDATLINRLQAGDEAAFRELVEAYQQMIISTCYGYLQNYAEAEDVAQEVFIQVHKSIGAFRGEARLSTWLYRIAVNRSLNKIRARKNKFLVGLDVLFDAGQSNRPAMAVSPHETLENKERAEVLQAAVNKLPANQKTAFVLSKYQGLPNKKIAGVMEQSLSAVEALLNRAKKNLQKHLVDYYKNR